MLSLSTYFFLLGADSALASAAIRIHLRDVGPSWRLPLAFALCDGLASLLGPLLRGVLAVNPNFAQTITLAAYLITIGITIGLLPMLLNCFSARAARLARVAALIGVPVFLSADNFFAAKASPGWTLGLIAAMAAISSYLMSSLGLAIGNAMRPRLWRFAWSALASLSLFAIAWIIA